MKGDKATRERHPRTAIWVALMVMLLAEALVYTWCRVQYVTTGYEIAQATEECQQLTELHRKLKVEEAHLRSPERIIQIARERGLVMPDSEQVVVVP
jgi:cell division protein FtsL